MSVATVTDRARTWARGHDYLLRYGVVGGFNTLLDLGLFTLFSVGLHITPLLANVMSTSIVLCVSYVLNRIVVFRSSKPVRSTVVHFVTITLFSGLIVQSGVIWVVIHVGSLAAPHLSHAILAPLAKVFAMGAGMISNYLGYRWIFHRR